MIQDGGSAKLNDFLHKLANLQIICKGKYNNHLKRIQTQFEEAKVNLEIDLTFLKQIVILQ